MIASPCLLSKEAQPQPSPAWKVSQPTTEPNQVLRALMSTSSGSTAGQRRAGRGLLTGPFSLPFRLRTRQEAHRHGDRSTAF